MQCYRSFGKGGFNPWYFEITKQIVWNPEGYSGRECFKIWDSEGRLTSTREPYIMFQVMSGKKLLNFNIEQWALGINDGICCAGELQEEFPWLPDWVWDSVRGQLYRRNLKPWEFPWHIEYLREQYK